MKQQTITVTLNIPEPGDSVPFTVYQFNDDIRLEYDAGGYLLLSEAGEYDPGVIVVHPYTYVFGLPDSVRVKNSKIINIAECLQ